MKSSILLGVFIFTLNSSAQTYLGGFSGYINEDGVITVRAESSAVRFMFYAPDILRIDLLPTPDSVIDSSFVVIQGPANNVLISIQETSSALTISSSHLQIHCQKSPLRFSFSDSSGRVLLKEPASGGLAMKNNARAIRFLLQENDHFFGTGERGTSLDKRGQQFESYNTQVPGYSTPLATMNLNVPFLATTNGYALYIDNIFKGQFDLGASDTTLFSYAVAGGEMSLYLIVAPTIQEQLAKYTWLTGRQPLPPRWAFGFIQSKNRYENEQEARSIVRTMREKNIPCDAIVLDLKWFDRMGDLSWNDSLWPNHDAMVADFLSQGMKTILITEPYIIKTSKSFNEAETNGYLATDSTGQTFLLHEWWSCSGKCSASLLDMTSSTARHWWWSKHPQPFGTRVAGIWTDLGEPERHPEGMIHHLGTAKTIHNIYNLLWAKTIFDGFSSLRPGERVMNLTRSGFAGIQRYGVLPWSGDVARGFGGLEVQIPMLLNMGMSGLAYHNSDIGGYSRMPTTPELYVRWMQYGTFCPIARAHGAGETVRGSATEPWQFGPEAEAICRDYIRLRYRLLPYIYTLAHSNYESGLPLARPLFWLDPDDKAALLDEGSSYMWGDALLVSPVVKGGQTSKELYLPRGGWINFWTDEVVDGGKAVAVEAPLEQMPLFVKAGSIIPMAQAMNYSDERAIDTLTLRVYPAGSGETSYTLYEDDGKSLEYQRGAFALTRFSQRVLNKDSRGILMLTVGESRGEYGGKLRKRVNVFEVHGIVKKPASVQRNGVQVTECNKAGVPEKRGNEFCYDESAKTLFITVTCQADSSYNINVSMSDQRN